MAATISHMMLIKENFKKRLSITDTEAEAVMIVYLAVAFNPKREKMVSQELLNHLGLSVSSPYRNENLAIIQQLAVDLKEEPIIARYHILDLMFNTLVINNNRLNKDVVNYLQKKPFNLKHEELEALARACEKGIIFLANKEKHDKDVFDVTYILGALGGIGGYYAMGTILSTYAASIPFSLGMSLVIGAALIAAVVTSVLSYQLYRLVNAAIRNYDYQAATSKTSIEKLAHSVAGFMRERSPEGDLSNLNQLKDPKIADIPSTSSDYIIPVLTH